MGFKGFCEHPPPHPPNAKRTAQPAHLHLDSDLYKIYVTDLERFFSGLTLRLGVDALRTCQLAPYSGYRFICVFVVGYGGHRAGILSLVKKRERYSTSYL